MKQFSDRLHLWAWLVGLLLLAALSVFSIRAARAAQGPALLEMPRPVLITITPVYDLQGNRIALQMTVTGSILEAVPSGRVERRNRSLDLDFADVGGREVGLGKNRTTYSQIGDDVLAMVAQELMQRYPPPLPIEATTQSGRTATRSTP